MSSREDPTVRAEAIRDAVIACYQDAHGARYDALEAQTRLDDARDEVFEVVLQLMCEQRALPQRLRSAPTGIPLPPSVLDELRSTVGVDAKGYVMPTEVVAIAFEMTYGLAADSVFANGVGLSAKRRNDGVFFTPIDLATQVAQVALDDLVSRDRGPASLPTVIDPSSGAGIFLIACLRAIAEGWSSSEPGSPLKASYIAGHCLYAVDKDATATWLARQLVWIEAGDASWDGSELERHIVCADSLTSPLAEWQGWFPEVLEADGGFDLVIGNPPWGAVKASRKEFLEHLDTTARTTYGSELRARLAEAQTPHEDRLAALWRVYQSEVSMYARALRDSNEFEHQGAAGDRDLYKYFMERSTHIAAEDGAISLIIPAGFLRAKGAQGLRELFLQDGRFVYVTEFINRKRLFPIHAMFRFAVLGYQKGRASGIHRLSFGATLPSDLAASQRSRQSAHLSRRAIKRLGGEHLLIPEIRSAAERRVLEKLFDAHPPLGDRTQTAWNVSFRREVDMTNDSAHFVHISDASAEGWSRVGDASWANRAGRRYRAVVEGRMVQQFDSSAKAYRRGVGRSAEWLPTDIRNGRLVPQFLFPEDLSVERRISTAARAGFRDVTGHANRRTVISAVLPGEAVAGNKVPTCEFDDSAEDLPHLWAALTNSFVVDWLARRYVSTTLNYFYLKLLPIPRIALGSEAGDELVSLSRSLSARPEIGDHAVAVARSRIDAIVADAYDLQPDDYALILDDFPLLDRGKHLQVTRSHALLGLAEMQGVSGDLVIDLREVVDQAERENVLAYG